MLGYKNYRDSVIIDENDYYQIGMTPMVIAAHRNNYRILQLLGKYGHTLEVSGNQSVVSQTITRRPVFISFAENSRIRGLE